MYCLLLSIRHSCIKRNYSIISFFCVAAEYYVLAAQIIMSISNDIQFQNSKFCSRFTLKSRQSVKSRSQKEK